MKTYEEWKARLEEALKELERKRGRTQMVRDILEYNIRGIGKYLELLELGYKAGQGKRIIDFDEGLELKPDIKERLTCSSKLPRDSLVSATEMRKRLKSKEGGKE